MKLNKDDKAVAEKLAKRTASNSSSDPETGVDLGAGPAAGLITGQDMGGAKDITEASKMADAL